MHVLVKLINFIVNYKQACAIFLNTNSPWSSSILETICNPKLTIAYSKSRPNIGNILIQCLNSVDEHGIMVLISMSRSEAIKHSLSLTLTEISTSSNYLALVDTDCEGYRRPFTDECVECGMKFSWN